ncbi:MAG: porin [Pseudomonadota bacterium]
MKGPFQVCLAGWGIVSTAGGVAAHDLSSLKAELESLQLRVSQLEAQSQSFAPAGYDLLSIRSGQPSFEEFRPEKGDDVIPENSGLTLAVLPTADVAPTSEIAISAELRTALLYSDFQQDDNADIAIRARVTVRGKTETAVGEVGGYFRIRADGGGDISDYSEAAEMQRAFGWWKFAPNWQLLAGVDDATAILVTSWDYYGATAPTRSFGPAESYNEQIRLTYKNDAWSFALSLEDPDYDTNDPPRNDIPSVQGYGLYSGDVFTGQVVGLWQSDDEGGDEWAVGAGAGVSVMEGFQVVGAGVVGEGTSIYANNLSPLSPEDQFWLGSLGILAKLTEETRIELGVGIEDYDEAGEALGFGGGIYWSPVSLVTLGGGITYVDFNDAFVNDDPTDDDSLQVFFGVWLKGWQYK